jgi:serine/threonine protein kinase/WD40 repeat protein
MKPEIFFLQYAVSLHCISPSRLAQFFKDHPYDTIPENIGDIMMAEGILSPHQTNFISEHANAAAAQKKKHPNSRTIVSITLSDGHMDLAIPDASDIFADPELRAQAFTLAGSGMEQDVSSAHITSATMTVGAGPADNEHVTALPTANLEREEQPVAGVVISPNTLLEPNIKFTMSPPAASTPADKIAIGTMFCHYQIQQELGRGGMGVVYKAFDTKLNRVVALKLILPGHGISETGILRFMQEIQAMAKLQHVNIVKLYEAGDRPQRYFTMEFIEGETLAIRNKRARIQPREAASLLCKIATAVHYAHEKGIVHRDIKPSNIMLDKSQEPRLMDFGTAKVSDVQSNLSRQGDMLGTPAYMPPEQAEGAAVDRRVDVYSLGATLYDLLLGRPPFEGESYVHVLQQILTKDPLPPTRINPDIPVDLEAICLKCLEKDKNKRYSDASRLAADITNFLENKPITAKPLTTLTYVRKFVIRNKVLCTLLSAFLLCAMLGTLLYIHAVRTERDKTITAKLREEEQRKIAEQEAHMAEKQAALARQEQQRAEQARQQADQARQQADQERQQAEQARQQAEEQRKIAEKNAAWAEQEKSEKAKAARIALTRLCKIALAKAKEAGERNQWRVCGAFCGTALEFIKALQGDDVDSLRQEGERLLRTALLQYGLIWQSEAETVVRHLAFTPDGNTLAAANENHTLALWQAKDGRHGKTLRGHTQAVYAVAVSPDGNTIASASADKSVRLWQVASGEERKVLNGHTAAVLCVAWNPDGKILASGAEDKTVKLWDVASGRLLKTCTGHELGVKSLSFWPGGNLVASAAEDRTIRLWEWPSGEQKRVLAGCLALFCPDGKTIACADAKPTAGLFEIGQGGRKRTFSGHTSSITSLAWSFDGKLLTTACGNTVKPDPTVRLWHSEKGQEMRCFTLDAAVHAVIFSPDGKTVATASHDGKIRLWDVASDRFSCSKPLPEWAVSLLPASLADEAANFSGDKLGWLGSGLKIAPQQITEKWFAYRITELLTSKPVAE